MLEDETTLKLRWPFSAIFAGPSFCGKTTLTIELIKRRDEVFTEKIDRIIYLYKRRQTVLEDQAKEDEDFFLVDSLDKVEGLIYKKSLIIIDDYLIEASGKYNERFTEFFISRSHHESLGIVLICQQCFAKNLRTISLNSTYYAFFNQPKDQSTIYHFARQFCPRNINYLYDSYKRATQRQFGYLWFDFDQRTNDKYRVRNCVFNDPHLEFYVENGTNKRQCEIPNKVSL